MYTTTIDKSPLIKVSTGKHETVFAVDGSQVNPLEAFYATLAACAGVYAKKSCKALGISAEGIEISCKPFAGPRGPLHLARFKTDVRFPDGFTDEQKAAVMQSIGECAVKEIVKDGANIDFQVAEV
jgi:uncharacterized OsmC-like protein